MFHSGKVPKNDFPLMNVINQARKYLGTQFTYISLALLLPCPRVKLMPFSYSNAMPKGEI